MLITDQFFLFYFFPIFILIYYFLRSKPLFSNLLIICASLFFYATFGIYQLPILVIPLLADFYLALLIFKTKNKILKQTSLFSGILLNIVLLGFFKYFNFSVENIHSFFPISKNIIHTLNIVVPVGISFITFQRISYIVDVYKGKVIPSKRFIQYAVYACLFPHLLSGPIVRFSQIAVQLKKRVINSESIFVASKYFVIGFAFKILIADQLLPIELYIEKTLSTLTTIESLILIFSFSARLYFDFLGYSLMAIGLAKFIGFDFPKNFNNPYKSQSITEFWRRWNITLSQWIRDYIYIPLGGNRNGELNTYRNLILAMLLAGLWHGASWNFVIWGFAHGLLLCIERIFISRKITFSIPKLFKYFYALFFIFILWVPFKFTTLQEVYYVLKPLMSVSIVLPNKPLQDILLFSLPAIFAAGLWISRIGEEKIDLIKPKLNNSFLLIMLFVITLMFSYTTKNTFFIYFQF